MTKEALKLALEALVCLKKDFDADQFEWEIADEAITAIKEALAQPEQETQAYREAAQLAKWLFKKHYAQEEHYASGRVVWGLCDTTSGVILQIDNMVCKLVLPKEQEQEPVAWAMLHDNGHFIDAIHPDEHARVEGKYIHPLYTTPPQRKPLSDEEIYSLADSLEIWNEDDEEWILDPNTFARAIEAAHGIKEST